MKQLRYLSHFILLFALRTSAQDSTTSTGIEAATPINNANVPTASGEIGINPVLDDLGDPNDYAATVGDSDSAFFVQKDGEYGYIATADDELAVTTTNGIASTIRVAATTATASADGVEVGDIAVVLPAAAASSLKDAVFSAVQSCGGVPAKLRRHLVSRQSEVSAATSCMIRAAHDAAQNDAVWGGVEAANWEALNLPLFEGIEEIWTGLLQVGINAAIRNRSVVNLSRAIVSSSPYQRR
jgi:hypothetical protein